jgi:hypothetical protein
MPLGLDRMRCDYQMVFFRFNLCEETIAQRINRRLASEHIAASGLKVDPVHSPALRGFQDAVGRMNVATTRNVVLRGNQRVRRIADFPVGVVHDPSEGTPPLHLTVFALRTGDRRTGYLCINRLLLLSRASSQKKSNSTKRGRDKLVDFHA